MKEKLVGSIYTSKLDKTRTFMHGQVIISSFKLLVCFLAWFWLALTGALQGNAWTQDRRERSQTGNSVAWRFINRHYCDS